ncbi:hypothetical protein IPG41_00830 [Candidatus Peregrinibacteria bacterium]|nr:MAG: hypothetical protein IPG41_00830 [Candidatus Peregrinibacteria bacterium]
MSAGLLELLLIYFLIVNKVIKVNTIFRILTISLSLQAVLALLQFFLGHSMGLNFLGEPVLSSATAHLAKINFSTWEFFRSYGTFAHPNILGGFLALSILGTLLYPPKSQKITVLLLGLQILGLITSFSRSALFSLTLALFFLGYRAVPFLKEKRHRIFTYSAFFLIALEVGILLIHSPLLSDNAWYERMEGFKRAAELFYAHPLGVGWSLETLFLDENSIQEWMPWDYQPTHNILLLLLVEIGVLGLFAFLLLLFKLTQKLFKQKNNLGTKHETSKKNFFLSMGLLMFCTGLLDHYWLTSESSRFLAMTVLASISRFLLDPLPIKALKSPKKLKPNLENPK